MADITSPQTSQPAKTDGNALEDPSGRLALVVDMVREMSSQSDPQALVSIFRKRALSIYGGDSSLSLSRRDLDPPRYRITRSTRWRIDINPWTQKERLPVLRGGFLGELLYGDEVRVIRDPSISTDDPAYDYINDARSFVSLPLFDGGVAVNMVVRMSADPAAFDSVQLADAVLVSNLFGRSTKSLLLAQRLQAAYAELDHENKRVAEIQRGLLPPRLPEIPSLDIAVSYETAARAGGDYYDFFDLGDGRWGILIADVSGHGTPAAVVMAMLRTMLHAQCVECSTATDVLTRANQQLCTQSDRYDGTFVTGFYGILDARNRTLCYACAGHNPPLVVDKRGATRELNDVQALPLAVDPYARYPQSSTRLHSGDTLLLYTDGITEAVDPTGEAYGRQRLLSCVNEDVPNAQHIIDCVVNKLIGFTGGAPQNDDQTLVALRFA